MLTLDANICQVVFRQEQKFAKSTAGHDSESFPFSFSYVLKASDKRILFLVPLSKTFFRGFLTLFYKQYLVLSNMLNGTLFHQNIMNHLMYLFS